MKKLFVYIMLVLAVVLPGCKKDDLFRIVNGPEFPWQTLQSFQLASNAPYQNIIAGGWDDPLGESNFYDFAASDISQLVPGVTGNVPWLEYSSRKYRDYAIVTGTRLDYVWQHCYNTIASCNDPLTWLAQQEGGGKRPFPEASQAEYDQTVSRIKAELLFFRGYSYFYLVQLFCPPFGSDGASSKPILPLRVGFSYSADTLRASLIATTNQVYDQILSDLTEAKQLMPKSYNEEGRVNYYAICGILARVYFLRGEYDKAMAECNELIEGSPYSLPAGVAPIESWNKSPHDKAAPEVIWEFVPDANGNGEWVSTSITKVAPWGAVNGGRGADWIQCSWVQFSLSSWALKYIDWMKDPQNGDYTETANALADKRYGQTWLRLEAYIPKPDAMDNVYYLNHYQTTYQQLTTPMVWCDKYYRGAKCDVTKQPILRLAEFYLTRAILRFNKDDHEGAAADLKVVRDRAGLPEITAAAITAEDIERERIKEMGAEAGDRIRYLESLRLPIGVGDRTGMTPIAPPYENAYWRVPESEIALNGGYPPGFKQ